MVNADKMVSLLGKSRKDQVVRKFADEAGGSEVAEIEDVWFMSFRKLGFSFRFDAEKLSTIELYVRGDKGEGFLPYAGELPHGLKSSFSRSKVDAAIGEPAVSKPAWAMYRFDDHALHIGYGDKSEVASMTLMSLDSDAARFHFKNLKK